MKLAPAPLPAQQLRRDEMGTGSLFGQFTLQLLVTSIVTFPSHSLLVFARGTARVSRVVT